MDVKITLTSEQLENLVRDITERVVEDICASDIADEMDVAAVAEHVNIDHSELAEHIDLDDVAEHVAAHIDMTELASIIRKDKETSEFLNEQIQKAFHDCVRPKITVDELVGLMRAVMDLCSNPFDPKPTPIAVAPVSLETAEEIAGIVQRLNLKAEIQDFGVGSKQVKISKS